MVATLLGQLDMQVSSIDIVGSKSLISHADLVLEDGPSITVDSSSDRDIPPVGVKVPFKSRAKAISQWQVSVAAREVLTSLRASSVALAISIVAHTSANISVPCESSVAFCFWLLWARALAIRQTREAWLVRVARCNTWVTDARARGIIKDLVLSSIAIGLRTRSIKWALTSASCSVEVFLCGIACTISIDARS